MEPPSNIAILDPDQNEALDALKLEGSQNAQGGRWHGNFAARVPRSVLINSHHIRFTLKHVPKNMAEGSTEA